VRELIEPLGYRAGQTILNVYLREVRPLFAPPPRTFQRTLYRPGEICQFDLWEPSRPIPVDCGQERRGWVVVACLGYSRAGAGVSHPGNLGGSRTRQTRLGEGSPDGTSEQVPAGAS
jgi:hypothetical protein